MIDLARLTLDDLRPGQRARVVAVAAGGPLQQRLMQLGLIEGTQVELVRRAPTGDPIEFTVLGYALSLRRAEARMVEVQVLTWT
ncbi:MAG: FeoA family protein [Chromatiales bacterium]